LKVNASAPKLLVAVAWNKKNFFGGPPRPYNEKETFSTQVALYGPRLYHLIVSFCGGVYREIDGKII